MADLAVGLSKSVVEGALARVQTVIEEDAKLRQKAQRDLVLISAEFEMMQSFLDVANDEMSTTKNKLVRTWVRHVRELADELEDCAEFVVHLDGKPIFWRRLLPSCIGEPLPLDQAVAEIEDLKGRARELSERYMRYSQISDAAGSKFIMLQPQASSRVVDATASNLLSKARDAAGRRRGLGDLTQLITKKLSNELQVISVWGTGGDHGMTSIIRKAYNDPEIIQNFACRSWVKLMHPFNPREFVRRFMAQVYANASQRQGARLGVHVLTKMEASQEDLLEEFVEQVNSKNYLVVLDNLTDMVDWDAVRTFLPDTNNGSSIIVSTQQFEIAGLCIGHSYQPLELKQFSPEHSICAFFKEGSRYYNNKEEKSMCRVPLSSMEEAHDWMKNNLFVGRESQMNELRNYTARARFWNSQVVSVWGIAGIGKSALVRSFYYDRMLKSEMFSKHRWVDVSHPFNLRDFSLSLISDHLSEKDPIIECRELLRQEPCLVVIDDLQSKEEWDLIQAALVSRTVPSVFIVITTEASIAAHCTDEEQVLSVKGLEPGAAMDLFRKEVQRKNPSSPLCDYKNAELDELILKCGGLPKVIVSIAALLATQTVTVMDTVRSLNYRFMQHLENNPEYDSLGGLFDWMRSYFRTFPDSLKPCIFYLSIFPPRGSIRRGRLVRRWIAEGYARDSEVESAVDRGERLFSQLLDLSIIEELPQLVTTAIGERKLASCQINNFMGEYIFSRKTEENPVFVLGPYRVLTPPRTGRHLVILGGWDIDRIMFESTDFSRLRSLTVFGKMESFFVSKTMKFLRVLDLENALGVKDEDLEKMVKQLQRLKFLSLRGCSEICHLPDSLGDLRQLQTLDVTHTSIVTLPQSIAKLQKLQHIRAGTTVPVSMRVASYSWLQKIWEWRFLVGVDVPRDIDKLTAFHTLGVVNVGSSGGNAIVKWLKKLSQLHKLGVSGINKNNCKDFFDATTGHVHLESLLVRFDEDNQGYLDGISLPWKNLRSLKLYGLQDKLPLSTSHLNKLRKLDLEMATLGHNDMEVLAKLPELCILRLRLKQLRDGKLHFFAKIYGEELPTYDKVKVLEIACGSSEVSHVVFGSKSMKNLVLLKVDCSSASYQLNGLDHLSELKQVLLKGADEAMKTAFEELLANHPGTPPTVKLEELARSS